MREEEGREKEGREQAGREQEGLEGTPRLSRSFSRAAMRGMNPGAGRRTELTC